MKKLILVTIAATLAACSAPKKTAVGLQVVPISGSEVVAGVSTAFGITATDDTGAPLTTYTGTVTFTLSDSNAQAVAPASYTFVAGDQGAHTVSATFVTAGLGQLVAQDSAKAGIAGQGDVVVHGLVYTAPASGAQTLQLVMDPTSTSAQVALQLVAKGAATGYSAGFNIKADATKAAVVGIATGNSLNPGSSPAAIAAALPSAGPMANVLSSGISQKATDTTANATLTSGQVLYRVTLRPTTIAPGVIFDGSMPFRAAVRDFEGNELLSQADFAIGKLELR